MASSQNRWPLWLALLASMALTAYLWFDRAPQTGASSSASTPAADDEVADATGSSGENSPKKSASRFSLKSRQATPGATDPMPDAATLPPMPPVDAPLAEAMDDLLTRAEAGEPEATCRLLLDLGACMENENTRQRREMLTQRAASTQSDFQRERMIDFLAVSQEASDRWNTFCAGTKPMTFADMERLLFQAAPRMSNRQRLLFTMSLEDGSLIRLPRSMQDYQPRPTNDGIISQFHADNDLEALEQGIAEADPLALEGKILLHIPTGIGKKMFDLREALPDPYKFTGYALMMQQLYGPDALGEIATKALDSILPALDPTTRESLQQQADTEVARWRETSIANPKSMPDNREQRSGSLCAD